MRARGRPQSPSAAGRACSRPFPAGVTTASRRPRIAAAAPPAPSALAALPCPTRGRGPGDQTPGAQEGSQAAARAASRCQHGSPGAALCSSRLLGGLCLDGAGGVSQLPTPGITCSPSHFVLHSAEMQTSGRLDGTAPFRLAEAIRRPSRLLATPQTGPLGPFRVRNPSLVVALHTFTVPSSLPVNRHSSAGHSSALLTTPSAPRRPGGPAEGPPPPPRQTWPIKTNAPPPRQTAPAGAFPLVFGPGADAYSEAISLDPNNAKAYRNQGVAFLHHGEEDRGLDDLDAAILLDSNLSPSSTNIPPALLVYRHARCRSSPPLLPLGCSRLRPQLPFRRRCPPVAASPRGSAARRPPFRSRWCPLPECASAGTVRRPGKRSRPRHAPAW
jgi:hypothetical protein